MGDLVSVCIPCRNAAPYLPAALDSVLAQTYPHIEVVVVNDGSADESGAILDDYACRHGIKVVHGRAGNGAKARNVALQHATGQFIKFFDADDLLSPDIVELQVDRLKQDRNSVASARWVRFGNGFPHAEPTPDATWQDLPSLEWLLANLAGGGGMLLHGMCLFPRSIVDQVGHYDGRLTLLDDLDFHTRAILAADRVLHTDGILYYRSGIAGSEAGQQTRLAFESAVISISSATANLLSCEDSPRVRRVCADLAQGRYYQIAVRFPDLAEQLAGIVQRCGGSSIGPSGGPVYHAVSRLVGWRTAALLRDAALRRGYGRLRRRLRAVTPSANAN